MEEPVDWTRKTPNRTGQLMGLCEPSTLALKSSYDEADAPLRYNTRCYEHAYIITKAAV